MFLPTLLMRCRLFFPSPSPSPRHEWSSLLSAPCSVLGWDIGTSAGETQTWSDAKAERGVGAWQGTQQVSTGTIGYTQQWNCIGYTWYDLIWIPSSVKYDWILSPRNSSMIFPSLPRHFSPPSLEMSQPFEKSGSLAWSVPVSCHSLLHLAAKHQKRRLVGIGMIVKQWYEWTHKMAQ